MTESLEFKPDAIDGLQFRRAEIKDTDEKSVLLRAVPYDVEVPIDVGLLESFEPGAFRAAVKDPARVKLWHDHSDTPRGRIAGVATEIEDRADGSYVRARFAQTDAGRELHSLIVDGILDEASIEFRAIPKELQVVRGEDAVHVRHRRAHLRGVAVVPEGAYGRDALALSVRDIREKAIEKARAAALAELRALDH